MIFWEIFKVSVILLMLFGAKQMMRENKAIKTYEYYLKDSVYRAHTYHTQFDQERYEIVVDSLYNIQHEKLFYLKRID